MSATAATGGFVPGDRGRVGMACLIFTESAFFSIFLVAYLFYIGKSATGPQPAPGRGPGKWPCILEPR